MLEPCRIWSSLRFFLINASILNSEEKKTTFIYYYIQNITRFVIVHQVAIHLAYSIDGGGDDDDGDDDDDDDLTTFELIF